MRFPSKRLSVVLMSNDDHASIFQTGLTIARAYLKGDLRPGPAATTNTPAIEATVDPKAQASADLKEYEGSFASDEIAPATR